MDTIRTGFERLLEVVVVLLVVGLSLIVCAGFLFRAAGQSLVWYDEVASIGLCWLTYYGSALAALKGAHIGCPEVVNLMPPRWRVVATVVAELCVFAFFGTLAWTGMEVLAILENDRMVSLPWVPLRVTQSVIPIGAALVILAEALRLPQALAEARGAGFADAETKEAQMHAANANRTANKHTATTPTAPGALGGSAPR